MFGNHDFISIQIEFYFSIFIPRKFINHPFRNIDIVLSTNWIDLYGLNIFSEIFFH
jgi:hypothetical protein